MSNDDNDWLSDNDLKNLVSEKDMFDLNNVQMAHKMMDETLPMAAKRLANIILREPDNSIALRAIKELMDRVLGKATVKIDHSGINPQQSLQDQLMSNIEEMLAAEALRRQ